ncbi:hypothetical protein BTJ40_06700 [Microbulbifer sp. A4B17]|uniref:hypothetical protein n=1 Tax=Microbulbifer sp. A4B17 TaxID=359370 RepID=UPI000D52BDC2|nr:hypothetical protein [Microbulbifer sp. A4B17]AWF80521.1 hypothetical protein BTJ40_06700 [Microbulbifer sp. A4B17]
MKFKGGGIGSDRWNDDLYALNVTPQIDYKAFIEELEELEDQGIIEFELSGEWKETLMHRKVLTNKDVRH